MTKSSMRNYSILGLVLVAASAVTAFIHPSKDKAKLDSNGRLVASTAANPGINQLSCIATAHGAGCNVSATTDTSTGLVNTNHTSTDNLNAPSEISTSGQGANTTA